MPRTPLLKWLVIVFFALALCGIAYAIYENPKRGGTIVAVYFVVWWTTLFTVLPFRARSQVEAGEVVKGSEPGAPAKPSIGWYAMVNSIVAAIAYAAMHFFLLPLL